MRPPGELLGPQMQDVIIEVRRDKEKQKTEIDKDNEITMRFL
jgi:hypothetical protein